MWPAIIGGGLALGGALGGLLNRKPQMPEYQFDAGEIEKLIRAYRHAGMQGLMSLRNQEMQRATSQMAASGMEPTLALQQAMFTPIVEQISGARAGLEGSLAGTEMQAKQHMADMLYRGGLQGSMAQYGAGQDFWSGLADLGGTMMAGGDWDWLSKLFNQGGTGTSFYKQYGYKGI